jgi:hypothetical protein
VFLSIVLTGLLGNFAPAAQSYGAVLAAVATGRIWALAVNPAHASTSAR